jgi:hypothetical protein
MILIEYCKLMILMERLKRFGLLEGLYLALFTLCSGFAGWENRAIL